MVPCDTLSPVTLQAPDKPRWITGIRMQHVSRQVPRTWKKIADSTKENERDDGDEILAACVGVGIVFAESRSITVRGHFPVGLMSNRRRSEGHCYLSRCSKDVVEDRKSTAYFPDLCRRRCCRHHGHHCHYD